MNIVLYKPGTNIITHFIKNAIKRDNNYIGSNKKLLGHKSENHIWTNDIINPIYGKDGEGKGWDKTVDQINIVDDKSFEFKKSTNEEYREALKRRSEIANLTYNQIDKYVENNVTDLPSAKAYLKKLSKVVLGVIKMMDKE